MTDFAFLATCGKAASAAYQVKPEDQKAAFQKAGIGYIASIGAPDDDAQAIVGQFGGYKVVSFSGTRFSEGPLLGRLKEDFDNIDLAPMKWGAGQAAAGYAKRLLKVAPAILKYVSDDPWLIVGHSAGACQAYLFPALLPPWSIARVVGLAGPRCGDQALWDSLYAPWALHGVTMVANDGDIFFDWGAPWLHPVKQFVRLPDGSVATERPGINLSIADHSDALYGQRLEALAA